MKRKFYVVVKGEIRESITNGMGEPNKTLKEIKGPSINRL